MLRVYSSSSITSGIFGVSVFKSGFLNPGGKSSAVAFGQVWFFHGVLDQYREGTIHSHYGHGQIHERGYRDHFYEKPSDHWIKDFPEIQEFLNNQRAAAILFPRIHFSALLSNGKINVSAIGHGIDGLAESKFFYGLNIEQGQPLLDSSEGIVIGIGLAKALNAIPGDWLQLKAAAVNGEMHEIWLKVVGIFHTGSKDFDDKMLQIPIEAAQKLLKTDLVESISLGLKSVEDFQPVTKALEEKFPDLEVTSFEVLDAIYYQHSVNWLKSQFRTVQIIIITIVLLGIFNTISTSILERKQEIGNLRANGESFFDILKLLLSEGFILGMIGSLTGIMISLFLNLTILRNGITMPPGPGLTRDFVAYLKMEPSMAFSTAVVGVFAALLATFFAGIKIAKMPIGDAFRSI